MKHSNPPSDTVWEHLKDSKIKNIFNFIKIFSLIVILLGILFVMVLVIKFWQQEKKDIVKNFLISSCEESSTPTLKEMDDVIFELFVVSNIMLSRDAELLEDQKFFYRTPQMGNFIKRIVKQEKFFVWADMIQNLNKGYSNMKELFIRVKQQNSMRIEMLENFELDIVSDLDYIDMFNKYEVPHNMKSLINFYFPKEIYSESTDVTMVYKKFIELMNDTRCYCKQTSSFYMITHKPVGYKYCKSISWLLILTNKTATICAFLIILTNMILTKFITLLFKKVPFLSKSRKATTKVFTMTLALFFNTLVCLLHKDIHISIYILRITDSEL